MKLHIIDNYDSFTYNLVHYLEDMGAEVTVSMNDKVDWELVNDSSAIVLSPGPGLPEDAGELMNVLKWCKLHEKPILGVCLGMQAMAHLEGIGLYNQGAVKHGVAEKISVLTPSKLFRDLPLSFSVGLYHSWAVESSIENVYRITSKSSSNVVMSIEHPTLKWFGVQFHPESILTEHGKKILENFLSTLM